jgi:exopolyphosphatase / guanosine-5'-triphosphate,3'-diphosphate pyrophosphatase
MVSAVIDVGSNSILLLVARYESGSWITVFEDTRVTGLGQGTKTSGLLREDRIEETLQVLKQFFDAATLHGATQVKACATMAARIATNTPAFLERCSAQGTPVEVLSGDREAELGFLAVANDPLFAHSEILTIIDPGGHSTELVTARREESGFKIVFRKSFSVGALGLREGFLAEETPTLINRMRASQSIDDIIGLDYLPHQAGTAVVLGATGTNLISIRDKLTEWQPERVHGQYLDFEEISRALGWMFDMTDAQRAAIPGIEPGRERTLHVGCLILERFLNSIHVLGCNVSVRGWRHSLLSMD